MSATMTSTSIETTSARNTRGTLTDAGSRAGVSHGGPAWVMDSVWYHLYPLGLLGAPGIDNPAEVRAWRQSGACPERTLADLAPWVDHLADLGCNALYLGPVFQSTSHGYDTIDYHRVDDRLGTNEDLRVLVDHCHRRGVRVILDAVLNHAGRDFFAFRDLQEHGQSSMFRSWFKGVDFDRPSPMRDSFSYEGWHGHYDLVKFNLDWPWVREHLLEAVRFWSDTFGIDGLRLDAADCLDQAFLTELSALCRGISPDFWLMGEVVHGNYRDWVRPDGLHSVTNYEAYKGLWSSFNDSNFFELAWTLGQQFGPGGKYQGLDLYSFADNHDVNRIASVLKDKAWLAPLHCLLWTMPGLPSVYYGSESAIEGQRLPHTDRPLRPAFGTPPGHGDLAALLRRLSAIRAAAPALRHGRYDQVMVSHRLFAFLRSHEGQRVMVVANSAPEPARFNPLAVPDWMRQGSTWDPACLPHGTTLTDLLEPGRTFRAGDDIDIPAHGARILSFNA